MLLKHHLLLTLGKIFLRDPKMKCHHYISNPEKKQVLGCTCLVPRGQLIQPNRLSLTSLMAATKGDPLCHLTLLSFTSRHLLTPNQLFLHLKIFQNFYFWSFKFNGVLKLAHMGTSPPNSIFSNVMLVAWNQPKSQYLYYENQQTLQITAFSKWWANF